MDRSQPILETVYTELLLADAEQRAVITGQLRTLLRLAAKMDEVNRQAQAPPKPNSKAPTRLGFESLSKTG